MISFIKRCSNHLEQTE